MNMALLNAYAISVRRGKHITLHPTNFAASAGETVGIYGPNGAGKSTLLQALAGLLPLNAGTITLAGQVLGRDLTPLDYHRRIAAVFQQPLLLRGTVAHNVELGLKLRGISREERRARVLPTLQQLKIAHLAGRSVGTLSGGEAQRTSLARALVLDPEVLYLDEPFSALDQPTRRRLVQELAGVLRAKQMATVIITHDLMEASTLCDRFLILDAGAILQEGSPNDVIRHPKTERVAEIVGTEQVWDNSDFKGQS